MKHLANKITVHCHEVEYKRTWNYRSQFAVIRWRSFHRQQIMQKMELQIHELSNYLLVLAILVSSSNASNGKRLPFVFKTSLSSQPVFLRIYITHLCSFIFFSIKVIDVGGKTLSRGTDRGMAYAKFKAHKFSYLNVTNIGSDYVFKGSECGLACVNIPSCLSFNLAAFSDVISGKIFCELLPSDIYNNSKKFVASQFHHHYSIAVSEKSWNLKPLNLTYISLYVPFFSQLHFYPISRNY